MKRLSGALQAAWVLGIVWFVGLYSLFLFSPLFSGWGSFFWGTIVYLLFSVFVWAVSRQSARQDAESTEFWRRCCRILWLVSYALFLYYVTFSTVRIHGFPVPAETREEQRALYREYYVNLRFGKQLYAYYYKNAYFAFYYLKEEGLYSLRRLTIPGLNLLGNLFLMVPLAVILPACFPLFKRWYCFAGAVLLLSVSVEALQYLFMRGSCDVDDLFLNFFGAFAVMLLLKIPRLGRWRESLLDFSDKREKKTAG